MTTNSNHPAIPAGEQDERAAFEAWHQAEMWAGDYDPESRDAEAYEINDDGYYCDLQTQRAWRGWQARARMAAPAAGDARDAARYRFIRDVPYTDEVRSVMSLQQNAIMDAAIDAAIAAQQGEGGQ